MAAYLVARSKIYDKAAYKRYTDAVPSLVKRYGGRFLARGTPFEVLEGPETCQRVVIIEFPSTEKARAFYTCSEYKQAAVNRQAGGVCHFELVLVDGGIGADALSAH